MTGRQKVLLGLTAVSLMGAVCPVRGEKDADKIRINPVAQGKALPSGYEWVLASEKQGKQLLSIASMLTPMREDGTAIEQPYVIQCENMARSELGALAAVLVRPNNASQLPPSSYFSVDPTLVYSQLNFADATTNFETKVGASIPATAEVSADASRSTIRTNLFVVFTRAEIAATQAFTDCVASSLRNAGITGKVRIPTGLVVGGAMALTFEADKTAAGAGFNYKQLAGADLRVNFSNINLEYYQWGATDGLNASDILDPLKLPNPNPIMPIQTFSAKTSQYGFVAIRRAVTTL